MTHDFGRFSLVTGRERPRARLIGGVTASITKITAGTGYEYLTRQVARMDAVGEARPSLANYYEEKGESPGRWVGSGMAGLEGLAVGDQVTEGQMWNLYGVGYHPLAEQMMEAAINANRPMAEERRAPRLGSPFSTANHDAGAFQVEVARRLNAYNRTQGVHRDEVVDAHVRAQIRTEVAIEMFTERHGWVCQLEVAPV